MVREGGRKRVRESLDDTESDGERERERGWERETFA